MITTVFETGAVVQVFKSLARNEGGRHVFHPLEFQKYYYDFSPS